MNFPFQQIKEGDKIIRTLEPDVDSSELVWHRDEKDRIVRIIENEGWKFQKEDELPIDLVKNQKIFIKKEDWHRVLKGEGKLIVEIEEII